MPNESVHAETLLLDAPSSVLDGDSTWHRAGKRHDWRNHVPQPVRDVWSDLDMIARAAVFHVALAAANTEVWE